MPIKKLLIITSALLIFCLQGRAQQFGLSWISHPDRDDTSQIWFRHTFEETEKPEKIGITVVSTGYFELYVNERNVSTDVMTPLRDCADSSPIAITYDITRFVRRGENTLALWYSPLRGHADSMQVAAICCARYADGSKKAFHTDGGWLCRKANVALNGNGGEDVDATNGQPEWNGDITEMALWMPAKECLGRINETLKWRDTNYPATKITNIQQQKYFDIAKDSVTYTFETAFRGLIRITLRDTRRGCRLTVAGMRYTCSGESDEQIIQRFTTTDARRLIITGDKWFRPEQVYKVEALSVGEYRRGWKQ